MRARLFQAKTKTSNDSSQPLLSPEEKKSDVFSQSQDQHKLKQRNAIIHERNHTQLLLTHLNDLQALHANQSDHKLINECFAQISAHSKFRHLEYSEQTTVVNPFFQIRSEHIRLMDRDLKFLFYLYQDGNESKTMSGRDKVYADFMRSYSAVKNLLEAEIARSNESIRFWDAQLHYQPVQEPVAAATLPAHRASPRS